MSSKSGMTPCGAGAPLRVSGHLPENPRGRLRKRIRRNARLSENHRRTGVLLREEAREDRLAVASRGARRRGSLPDRLHHGLRTALVERRVNRDEGVHFGSLEERLEGLPVRLRSRREDELQGVADRRAGGEESREPLRRRLRERRHGQTGRLAGARAEDAGTAPVREDRDAAPCRKRLPVESGREVEHLVQRVGPDDPRLTEERVHDGFARDERRGGGSGGLRGRSRLHDDDRLFPAHDPRDPGEAARISEGLQIEKDDACRIVPLPVLQKVVAGDVGLVADADEGRDADMALPRESQHRHAEDAALGRHRHAPAWRQDGGDRGVEPDLRIGVDDAHRVGTDEAHPVAANPLEELLLQVTSSGIAVQKADRDDDEGADAGGGAIVHGIQHALARDRHDGEIGPLRDLAGRRVGRQRVDVRRIRVHRVDRAVKAALNEPVEDAPADAGDVA